MISFRQLHSTFQVTKSIEAVNLALTIQNIPREKLKEYSAINRFILQYLKVYPVVHLHYVYAARMKPPSNGIMKRK